MPSDLINQHVCGDQLLRLNETCVFQNSTLEAITVYGAL